MKNEEQKLGRQTSLELLRIISMLMIVAGHSVKREKSYEKYIHAKKRRN